GSAGTDNRKLPWGSVKVPTVPPFTVTETACTPSCVPAFFTEPVMVDDCENAWEHKNKNAVKKAVEKQ
ncbi:MAG: hypothetical protein V4676_11300, partial [Bacteroidota bacterium]